MSPHMLAAAPVALSSTGLVTYLQTLFIRFVQFFVLAVAIAVIFYVPGIVRSLAMGIAHALGVH